MKYAWTLQRKGLATELGIGTVDEIEKRLDGLMLDGSMPLRWILDDMVYEAEDDGKADHYHDLPPPKGWHLSWSRVD